MAPATAGLGSVPSALGITEFAADEFAKAVYESELSQVNARKQTHATSSTASIASGVPRLPMVLPALIFALPALVAGFADMMLWPPGFGQSQVARPLVDPSLLDQG